MKRKLLIIGLAVALAFLAFLASVRFIDDGVDSLLDFGGEPESKVYVTLMAHIEEGDIYTSCMAYPDYRDRLLQFSEIMHENGYRMNVQASYQYYQGVLDCETAEMMAELGGRNTVQFLIDEYDFEFDPHHEGSWDFKSEYNFADTRYIGGQVTDDMTDMIGIVWDYELQFVELDECQQGRTHTDFTFCPEIISGAVGYDHHLGDFSNDDPNSGVWIPAGTDDDFTTHNSDGRMVYIASGPHANRLGDRGNVFDTEADYIKVLLNYIEEGRVESQMLTAAVPIPQSVLFGGAQGAAELVRMLGEIRDEENLVFASYTEIADIWRDEYSSEPQIFLFSQVDEEDYTSK